MKLTLKQYKFSKIKQHLKSKNLFLIYNSDNKKNKIKHDQTLKELNVNSYKISNTITKKIFNKSVYKNLTGIINSYIITLKPNKNSLLKQIKIKLSEESVLLAVKLNNKIYSNFRLKSLHSFNYQFFFLSLLTKIKNNQNRLFIVNDVINSK